MGMTEAPHKNSFAAKPYPDRVSELQRRLGNPQTGKYLNRDYWKLKQLPHLNRKIIEWHYGVAGHEPRSQAQIARELGVKSQFVHETVRDSFKLLERLEELVEARREAYRISSEKRATPLNRDDRVAVRQAARALQDVLEMDANYNEDQ